MSEGERMEVVAEVTALRAALDRVRRSGRSIGFVPTMGALHEGHLSLVQRASTENDAVAVSIFVNPLQFGPGEDFEAYPRQLSSDLALLRPLGVEVVFTPDPGTFIPPDQLTTVRVAGLTERLEGAHRPGHFDGVTTIVAKLLGAVGPDRAYFGEKDYQQLAVVRRMATELDLPVEVIGCAIVRDPDGLALSSRNVYLSQTERAQALALWRALSAARDAWVGDADSTRTALRRTLEAAPGVRLDYAEVCHPETLEPLEGVVHGPARALVAAVVGTTRLIDNIRLDPSSPGLTRNRSERAAHADEVQVAPRHRDRGEPALRRLDHHRRRSHGPGGHPPP